MEGMLEMLTEIAAEIAAPTTTWSKEKLYDAPEPADLFKGVGKNWTLQVVSFGRGRMGTAVSTKRNTVVKLTDQLAQAAETRARVVLITETRARTVLG